MKPKINLQNIDEFIIKEKYNEALLGIIKYFEDKTVDKILNILKYKELLINKESNIKKKTKLIEPLKKYLKKKGFKINNYIECCDLINAEYKNINCFRKEQFKKLYKYDMKMILFSIISKMENYNHKIIRHSNKVDNQFHNYDKMVNCINEYEANIEGLGILIKDILSNSNEFNSSIKFETREEYIANLKRCNKKTFKINELVFYLNSIVNIESLRMKIKNNDFKVVENEDFVYLEYVNIDEYKKREIANLRCYIHDCNDVLEYEKEFSQIEEVQKMLREINSDEIDLEKLIIYDESNNHFSVKYDLLSREFCSVLIEIYKEFIFQTNEMLKNNFIDDEIYGLVTIDKEKLDITYKEVIDFYFILKSISLVYYKSVEKYWFKFNKESCVPFMGSDLETFKHLINQLYRLLLDKELVDNKFEQLVDIYTFSKNNIYDLYYKPIIKIENKICIIPSVLEKNNFNRTFLKHMHKIKAKIKEGRLFENFLKDSFKAKGFKVYDKDKPKLNFDLGNGIKGDIDLLMIKGKYIFYCQIKNRENPIEEDDYKSFDRKINHSAIKQLRYAGEFLKTNPENITQFFNITDLNQYKFIPFIITNSFYASGYKRKGIYIIDTSALLTYFKKKKITIKDSGGNIKFEKSLITKNVEEGFVELLRKPYFKDEKLYHQLYFPRLYYVGKKMFILKAKDDIIEKQLNGCYLRKEVKEIYGKFKLQPII